MKMTMVVVMIMAMATGLLVPLTHEHGLMIEPPARNAMWRVGFNTTPNYEDTEMFCGGISNQWKTNKGKCGICGDSYNQARPRRYETGGWMVKNITARVYPPGGAIDVVILLVANHMGTFTFSLCPRDSFDVIESEECFIPLLVNGKANYTLSSHRKGYYNMQVQLPPKISCKNCILRWHWRSANNWGACSDGHEAVGCGPQETYRNCADIVLDHERGTGRGPFINRPLWHLDKFKHPHLAKIVDDDHITYFKLS